MKKILLFVVAVVMSITASATELFTGSHHVSWDTPLNLEAAKFADAQPGQKLVIEYTEASDGIECKVMDVWSMVPGLKKENWISGEGTFEFFFTQPALDALKEHGLQLIGNNFTVTAVNYVDGKVLKEGTTIWTGFCWANEWENSTLVLNKETATSVDWSKYKAVRVYHEAGRNNFDVNLRRNWDAAGFIVGTDGTFAESMTITDAADHSYKEFALTDAARAAAVISSDEFLMQCYKGDGDAFNITDIVLVEKDKYTRDVTNGDFGTICLARASESVSGATLYKIVDKDATGIIIEQVDAMEAGTPYIFQATDDELRVVLTGDEASVQDANGLVGFLGDGTTDVPQNGHCYVIAFNQLHLVNSDVTIATNRAYIDIDAINPIAPAPDSQRRVVKVADSEQVVTAVSEVTTAACQKMIVNGRLLIVREGIKYNVQGQVVR